MFASGDAIHNVLLRGMSIRIVLLGDKLFEKRPVATRMRFKMYGVVVRNGALGGSVSGAR